MGKYRNVIHVICIKVQVFSEEYEFVKSAANLQPFFLVLNV